MPDSPSPPPGTETSAPAMRRLIDGCEQAADLARQNVVAPFVNSLVLEPLSAVRNVCNAAGKALVHKDILPAVTLLAVPEAAPMGAQWAVQQVSSALGMLVPYAGAGRLALAGLRAARLGARGLVTVAEASRLERGIAQVAGAALYDGTNNAPAGQSHLAAMAAGGAQFSVMELAAAAAARLPLYARLPLAGLAGAGGSGVGSICAAAVDHQPRPTARQLSQNVLQAGVVSMLLPAAHEGLAGLGRAVRAGLPVEPDKPADPARQIMDRFNVEPISLEQLKEIIRSFPETERPLALAFLQRSALNCSDVGVRAQLRSIKPRLPEVEDTDAEEGGAAARAGIYTLTAASSGNFLGYLYRKANDCGEVPIRNFDRLVRLSSYEQGREHVILFDDLTRTPPTEQQRAVLSRAASVTIVDLRAFEKGINLLDLAKGPEATREKLAGLVAEARALQAGDGALSDRAAVRDVLDRSAQKVAESLAGDLKLVRPSRAVNKYLSLQEGAGAPDNGDPVESLHRQLTLAKAPRQRVVDFLADYRPQDHQLLADMLTRGADYFSVGKTVRALRTLDRQINAVLEHGGTAPENLLVVTDRDPGGSAHLVTYMLGQVGSTVKPANLVSSRELGALTGAGAGQDKVVMYLDDGFYTGAQAQARLGELQIFQPQFKTVIFAGLAAAHRPYDPEATDGGVGMRNVFSTLRGGDFDLKSKRLVNEHWKAPVTDRRFFMLATRLLAPYNSQANSFFRSLDPPLQERAQELGGQGGWGKLNLCHFWFWHYPDSNAPLFQRFGRTVLQLYE